MLSRFNNDEERVHVVGVYESNPYPHTRIEHQHGWIDVIVTPKAQPIVLVLSSYEGVTWNVSIAPGASVSKIIVGGVEPQKVVGQGARIPALVYTYELSDEWGSNVQIGGDYFYLYQPYAPHEGEINKFPMMGSENFRFYTEDQKRQELNQWRKLFSVIETTTGETHISSFQGIFNADRKKFVI